MRAFRHISAEVGTQQIFIDREGFYITIVNEQVKGSGQCTDIDYLIGVLKSAGFKEVEAE